jgi:hypothetical protein
MLKIMITTFAKKTELNPCDVLLSDGYFVPLGCTNKGIHLQNDNTHA